MKIRCPKSIVSFAVLIGSLRTAYPGSVSSLQVLRLVLTKGRGEA
jgi:hypothetical protein